MVSFAETGTPEEEHFGGWERGHEVGKYKFIQGPVDPEVFLSVLSLVQISPPNGPAPVPFFPSPPST